MRLRIVRRQKPHKNGIKFVLWFRLELTQEEGDLATKYDMWDRKITYKFRGHDVVDVAIRELVQGLEREDDKVEVLAKYHREVQSACEGFVSLLALMSVWDGEQIVELSSPVNNSPLTDSTDMS